MSTTSTAGSGRTREPGEIFRKILLDATSIDDAGYVLVAEIESTVDKVDLAAFGEFPYCVNMRSTTDPFDVAFPPTTFLTGSDDRLATIDCSDDGEHALKVANNNAAIAVGDPVVVAAGGGGKIDAYTVAAGTLAILDGTSLTTLRDTANVRLADLGRIVGYAQEAVVAGSGGLPGQDKCRTRLTIKQVPLIV